MTFFVHPLADVQTQQIGEDTRIWQSNSSGRER